jgi:NADPH-dependent curcumin reductase CurA
MGLKVLAIHGGSEKAALCGKLGADAVIDFRKTKVTHIYPKRQHIPKYFMN